MLMRSGPAPTLAAVMETIRALIANVCARDNTVFAANAQRLCDQVSAWKGSRFQIPTPIDGGLAISTIVKHKPRKHPPTTNPREFDTLFFAALFLLEVAGMRFTFQWLRGKFYLRAEISSGAGQRCYVARIILNAGDRRRAQFDEDHHSYRLRDLIQRAGPGGLPPGECGRQTAIDSSHANYEVNKRQHHTDVSPDEYRALLTEVLTVAMAFHGTGA